MGAEACGDPSECFSRSRTCETQNRALAHRAGKAHPSRADTWVWCIGAAPHRAQVSTEMPRENPRAVSEEMRLVVEETV
ncbi:hypothetical protein NDU88_007898 [Pleurodeles waltl]|uniref:Uncharacterized protein n=1 Tax=Pleurodeles waltl TaxID=8319 RepID=A0AAV7QND8_PLEWA|nr:hypothetical protein NDU88_007898 [Pleurodeles waltl]